MSPLADLDDAALAAHLARRCATPTAESARARDERLAVAVGGRIAERGQWAAWRVALVHRTQPVALAGITGAVALIAFVALSGLLPSGPTASSEPDAVTGVRALSTEELVHLVGRSSAPGVVGRVVVVDADVEVMFVRCRAFGPCPVGRIAGTQVLAYAEDLAGQPLPTSGPLAVRVRELNAVDLVGHVRTPADGTFAWRMPDLLDKLERIEGADRGVPVERLVPALYAVDGWLSGMAVPASCPAPPLDETGQIRAYGPFECGGAAWLVADDRQPNVITVDSDSTAYSITIPVPGLRVQNGAYGTFARDPTGGATGPEPRRAVYLVRPALLRPDGCFICTDQLAEIVARLDPVEGLPPPTPAATPTATADPTTTPTTRPAEPLGVQLLGLDELGRLLQSGDAVGRVVVADVVVRAIIAVDCAAPGACGIGYVEGSDPLIAVFGEWVAFPQPPFAFRIQSTREVDLLGRVVLRGSETLVWSVRELADEGLPIEWPGGLFAVDGWLSGGYGAPPCPPTDEPTPPPDLDYGCGPTAWLGPTDAAPVDNRAPDGAIRVQNGAYQAYAPAPGGDPSRAVYLVEWLARTAMCPSDPCYGGLAGPLLHIVARIDPIDPG